MNEEMKEREGILAFNNVGQNDKYLINKLRSYNITLEKIDQYLVKLAQDNSIEQNRALNTLAQYL